ncbi:uncharacterized protein [Nothobranchius furzeri]|uniref:uncharacterized protein isoform X2 n=1 Tax=Nothobranchius furzeri TaxID=105023 RepID=UPI0039049C83
MFCFPSPKPPPVGSSQVTVCTCSGLLPSACYRSWFPHVAPAVSSHFLVHACRVYACRSFMLQFLLGPMPAAAVPAGSHVCCCSLFPVQSSARVPGHVLMFLVKCSSPCQVFPVLSQGKSSVPSLLCCVALWASGIRPFGGGGGGTVTICPFLPDCVPHLPLVSLPMCS